MIKIDIAAAVSIYLCLSIFLVFLLWIFYNFREPSAKGKTDHLRQCPYCTHVFFNDKAEGVAVCPQCQSYISLEEPSRGS